MSFQPRSDKWLAASMALLGSACVLAFALLTLLSLALGALPTLFPNDILLPIGRIRGVEAVDDTLFVASGTSGRVMKYDLPRHTVTWDQMPKRPIEIAARDGSLVLSYSGEERLVLESRLGERRRPTTKVECTWWGHPFVLLSSNNTTQRVELQPWYITVVQTPWPGLIYVPALILSLVFAHSRWKALWKHPRVSSSVSTV
jgi:hypothetical protein